jgi:hypothetical protein
MRSGSSILPPASAIAELGELRNAERKVRAIASAMSCQSNESGN